MNSDDLNLLQPVVPAGGVTANNGPGMEQRAVPAEGALAELLNAVITAAVKAAALARDARNRKDEPEREFAQSILEPLRELSWKVRNRFDARAPGGNAKLSHEEGEIKP